jgi:hypothetical protein
LMEIDPQLINCLMLVWEFIEGRGGKHGIQKTVQRQVHKIYYKYGIQRDEIVSRLVCIFRDRNRHLKYDPTLSSLEKYVAWFVYYQLLTISSQCREHLKKSRTVPLSELEDGQKISKIGGSINPHEKQVIDGLINSDTPEDELIGKELMHLALDFFGDDDLAVILGARSRAAEAEKLGIDYFTFCKRLKRKTLRFRSYLKNLGYID